MKKLSLLLMLLPIWGFGQTTDLLISEYGEGSGGNKKYIEIYNGTGATVDLATFQLWKNSNGSAWSATTLALSGNLLNGQTYVIANNNIDVSGADLYNTFLNHNGDDAIALAKFNGVSYVIIDQVGEELIDPGTGWEVAGIANGTQDKILVRKPAVCSPNTNWTLSRGTNTTDSEWTIFVDPYNNIAQTTNLGSHASTCGGGCNTFITLTESACDSLVSPSGNYTWTASGTYLDTIPNAALCDSVLTINLTINPSYAGVNATQTICSGQSYVFGTQTLTTAGAYTEIFETAAGCDSTVNLTLTVVSSFTSSSSATICAGESYILGAQTLTTSGVFSETFTSVSGCDSVVTVTLTVNPVSTSTITENACDSYTSPSGDYTWEASGTYTDTIPAANGCDSVITINLTVGTSNLITTTASACDSYTFLGTEYSTSGTYDIMFTNATGCDSIQQLVLTITESPETPTTSGDQTLCSPDTPEDLSVQAGASGPSLIISGIADCPLPGGLPKVVTFYAINDIADLSLYGFGSANNGGGSNGQEFTFPAVALSAGEEFIVATDSAAYAGFFGGVADAIEASAANVNGDDAIELFFNSIVIDVMGDINVDGSGQPWDYLDGWVYRSNGSQPNNGVFDISEWTFSGIDVFDGQTTNASSPNPFPISTFSAPSSTATYTWYEDAALTIEVGTGETFATGQTAGSEDYYVVATVGTCESDAAMIEVTINETPIVGLELTTTSTCINYPVITLAGGNPTGGTYSGDGVTGTSFNPATAGLGAHEITYSFTENGCTAEATSSIFVDGCVSIEELTNELVTVFPNPTKGIITISQNTENVLAIEIVDITGKVVHSASYKNVSNTVDMSGLESGSYFLNIQSEAGIQRMTIVKN